MGILISVAFISNAGGVKVMKMAQVPRVGDKVALFYRPMPTVKEVIWFSNEIEADVIVIVE